MTERSICDYLEDLLNAIDAVEDFIAGMKYSDFISDRKTMYASVRAIQIIGEATKKIPEHIRQKYTHIPWREMAGMRDKVTHEYFGINNEILWKTLREDLPSLKNDLLILFNDIKNLEQ